MLKEAVASKAAKLLMTCVCPVAGTTALSLGVPQVRDAVYKATQPRQYAKPKTRVRAHGEDASVEVASRDNCPTATPFAVSDMPLNNAGTPEVADMPPGVADLIAHSSPQVAEIPQPDAAVALTPRIFIPRVGSVAQADGSDGQGTMAWAELILGAS